jgi:glycosyltransferase domain-containing protein
MSNIITIIIPTFERSQYIKKSLSYWNLFPVNLIILDGSKVPSLEFSNLSSNIQYYHLPISIYKRFEFVADKINGKYAALISDDEFLSYSALLDAVNILDNNPDVSGVLGATAAFRFKNKISFNHIYKSALHLNISSVEPTIRIEQRASVTENSIFYPLTRVSILKTALRLIGNKEYTCTHIAEYQMEAVLCNFGKIIVMPKIFWFRSMDVPYVSNNDFNRSIYFHEWVKDSKNINDLVFLKESVTKFMQNPESNFQQISGEQFVKIYSKSPVEVESERTISGLLKIYRFCIPFLIRKNVRVVLNYINGMDKDNYYFNTNLFYNYLNKNNIKYNDAEFNLIIKLLEK